MEQRRTVAYVLIGLGVITLLARVSDGAAWLWIGLLAAAALYAYARQRTYGFLVLGCILGGTAVGILLQQVLRFDGPFLISLGVGIAAIDMIEPRPSRWPRTLGAILVVLGLLVALSSAGVMGSLWFALLLIAAGVLLIARRPARGFPPTEAADPPAGAAPPAPPMRPAEGPPATPPAERAESTAPAAPAAPPRAAPPGDDAGGFPSAPAGSDAAARRRALEAWRERTAAEEGRSPQSVVADEVLDAIATRAPRDLIELGEVRGMGPVRLERYGQAILGALRREA